MDEIKGKRKVLATTFLVNFPMKMCHCISLGHLVD